ncbi:MAG: glycoside hydrolase family 32 protein [Saprospiraceae bacterium]|nr:glycoside hydrolase family 32 protein [Saprospiraceae bacterium]
MLQKVFILAVSVVTIFGCNNDVEKEMPSTNSNVWFQEPHRPQIHFTPQANWMNDPNGMVYYDGEYHLFYQYYPDSTVWGPMHWGHAVSTDLVHWEHLPIALYPDSLGYIFSGSAVVDHNNSSGLGKDGKPALIAIFTHHDAEGEKAGRNDFQYQSIAYSNDKGRTWTKYEGNPVVPNEKPIRDFRDPKVIWDEMHQQWLMVFAAADRVMFWTSNNLIDWKNTGEFGADVGGHGGVWECPDLFPIQVKETGDTKWVLLLSINPGGPNSGSATQYFVGDFDGNQFTLDPSFVRKVENGRGEWIDYGRDNYAGVTWSDLPRSDHRKIFLGWMSNWDYAQVVPTKNWRSAMTVPREITLHFEDEYYLTFNPVKELKTLYKSEKPDFVGELGKTKISVANPSHIELELPDGKRGGWQLTFSNDKGEEYSLSYDRETNLFSSDRRKSGATAFSEKFAAAVHTGKRASQNYNIPLDIYLDHASIEIFADNGRTVFTEIFFPESPYTTMELRGVEGDVVVHALQSIWEK